MAIMNHTVLQLLIIAWCPVSGALTLLMAFRWGWYGINSHLPFLVYVSLFVAGGLLITAAAAGALP